MFHQFGQDSETSQDSCIVGSELNTSTDFSNLLDLLEDDGSVTTLLETWRWLVSQCVNTVNHYIPIAVVSPAIPAPTIMTFNFFSGV